MFDATGNHLRRNRQVIDTTAGNTELPINGIQSVLELGVGRGVIEASGNIEESPAQVGPMIFGERVPGKMSDAVPRPGANPFVRITFGAQPEADNGEVRGEHAVNI